MFGMYFIIVLMSILEMNSIDFNKYSSNNVS